MWEHLSIPNVKAIIEKVEGEEKYIVLQRRNKPLTDPYTQRFEIPGGKLRAFEGIYDALKREITEECGLELVEVVDFNKNLTSEIDDLVETVRPFTVYQMTKGPYPSMGLVFICRAMGDFNNWGDEAEEPFWIELTELNRCLEEEPSKFTLLDRAVLLEYLNLYWRLERDNI